jgi:transketolase
MEINVPGTAWEFDRLFKEGYDKGLNYFRLSAEKNEKSYPVEGEIVALKHGVEAIVVAVGPMLDAVLKACDDMDVTILYFAHLPRGRFAERKEKIIICEPYYSGGLDDYFEGNQIYHIGVPREFIHKYGKREEIEKYLGLDARGIEGKIKKILKF